LKKRKKGSVLENRFERNIKGGDWFSNSFLTLLSLSNRNCSSLSLVSEEKKQKKEEDDLHLQPFFDAVVGHPRVAAPPPELHKITPFSKLNTYLGILFHVEYKSGLGFKQNQVVVFKT